LGANSKQKSSCSSTTQEESALRLPFSRMAHGADCVWALVRLTR
jgi:hypothetical protein